MGSLKSNITYHLSNMQEKIRKSVEIAFGHLQRQLVADSSIRETWSRCKHETDFEKLGGSHLLSHKLWGFKIDAVGERTDLVLSEKIEDDDPLYKSVDGLVLTEWKVVRDSADYRSQIENAKKQVKRYSSGALGAVELSNYYYLVLVSQDYLKIDNNCIQEAENTYRIVNIAYAPSSPSRSK